MASLPQPPLPVQNHQFITQENQKSNLCPSKALCQLPCKDIPQAHEFLSPATYCNQRFALFWAFFAKNILKKTYFFIWDQPLPALHFVIFLSEQKSQSLSIIRSQQCITKSRLLHVFTCRAIAQRELQPEMKQNTIRQNDNVKYHKNHCHLLHNNRLYHHNLVKHIL